MISARRAVRPLLAAMWASCRRDPRRTMIGAAFCLTLVGLLAATFAFATRQTHAAATTAAPASGVVRFNNTVQDTSFVVQTDASDSAAGVFTFVTPDGSRYHGGQASDLQDNGNGILHVHFDGSARLLAPSGASTSQPDGAPVQIHLNAVLDLFQLRATAELSDDTNLRHFVLVTETPAGEQEAVDAVTQAFIQQDWATLYGLTSSVVTSQMTEAQFAQAMAQQVQSQGVVTAVTVTSAPQAGANPAGATFFTVAEQVTLSQNDVARTQSVTSLFVLEGGAWKLFTSKPR